MDKFTRQTFHYFEEAEKNARSKRWFTRHEELFREEVREPFVHLLKGIEERAGDKFPGFTFHHSKVTRPLYKEEGADGALVRNFSWAFLSEKRTSLFEWNPGISLSFSSTGGKVGVGLYHPSSRQMNLIRESIIRHPATVARVLEDRRLRTVWGDLTGEKFLRFPRGFDPEAPGAKYLWHKQFIFEQEISRREILSSDLADRIARDLKAASAFMDWMRKTVGVYAA